MSTSRKLVQTVLLLVVMGTLFGCAGLIPTEMQYRVGLEPILPEGRGDYFVDPDDSSAVFSIEGALIKVKHLPDQILNEMYPPLWDGKHINPYASGEKDLEKGYIPPIFTVFEVTVINKTYAKIEFDPGHMTLITDEGKECTFYDAERESASPNNFRKYYKVELGISGNEKQLALERMGLVYKTAYHRERPVFRGVEHSGFVTFDPLPENTKEITLRIENFVLSFDASGNPEKTTNCEFRFKVNQGTFEVVAPAKGA